MPHGNKNMNRDDKSLKLIKCNFFSDIKPVFGLIFEM